MKKKKSKHFQKNSKNIWKKQHIKKNFLVDFDCIFEGLDSCELQEDWIKDALVDAGFNEETQEKAPYLLAYRVLISNWAEWAELQISRITNEQIRVSWLEIRVELESN